LEFLGCAALSDGAGDFIGVSREHDASGRSPTWGSLSDSTQVNHRMPGTLKRDTPDLTTGSVQSEVGYSMVQG